MAPSCHCHSTTSLLTTTRAALGSGKQGKERKTVTSFIPWGMRHYFNPINVNVPMEDWNALFTGTLFTWHQLHEKSKCSIMSTHSEKNTPFTLVMWSLDAPETSRISTFCLYCSTELQKIFMFISVFIFIQFHFPCRWLMESQLILQHI